MRIVVGSGPAGVACAKALLKKGHAVTLLDAGKDLEEDRKLKRAALAAKPPREWQAADLQFLLENQTATAHGIPLKTVFGSDFPYERTSPDFPIKHENVDLWPSFARGGLSNVWGAAVMPFHQDDLDDWPISSKDLDPHYEAVLEWMPLSGQVDALQRRWPLYTQHPQALRSSRQAQALAGQWTTHAMDLGENGIQFGSSRLAVHADAAHGASACVYCRQCLYGCPFGSIFNSSDILSELMKNERFTYLPDIVVKRVEEKDGKVTLHAIHRKSREKRTFTAERAYLGAGVLPTAKILLESLEAYDRPLEMRTSQYLLFPLLSYQSTKNVEREALHTLAQLFLEIRSESLSPYTIHLQLYTYNDFYLKALKKMGVGYLLSLSSRLRDALLGRLFLVQGYLHSKDSAIIKLNLSKGERGGESLLSVQSRKSALSLAIARKLMRHLWRSRKSLGFFPLSPFLNVALPGIGSHNGGTFPMRKNPGPFETDIWGRPQGLKRVHVVDASVFPSIPATTITFSVMANAYRIGSFDGE